MARTLIGRLAKPSICHRICAQAAVKNNLHLTSVTTSGSAQTRNATAPLVKIACRLVGVIGNVWDIVVGFRPNPKAHQHLGELALIVSATSAQASRNVVVRVHCSHVNQIVLSKSRKKQDGCRPSEEDA